MPSKSKSKGKKGGKSKGKGKGKKGPKKLSKKEIKLRAKYRALMIEDKEGKEVLAIGLRRDELEWATEKAKEAVLVQREERIRFQLERDFLHDVMQTYWKKYRCMMIEEEKKIADNNRMHQDADDNQTIKSIEGKHFRYESQINCTMMDVRDEIRKQRLKTMLERQWQDIAMEIEDLNEMMEKNAEKYRQQIAETMDKMEDLQKYVDDHATQLAQFKKDMQAEMENSKKLFHLMRRMEYQMTEERWAEFIWKLSRNFEIQNEAMKTYYNDTTHSNLTLIFTLQDLMNDSTKKKDMYKTQIDEYIDLMEDAIIKMPALKKEYTRHRVKHDFIVRTRRGIKTTRKQIGVALEDVNKHKGEFRQLLHQFTTVTAERDRLKEKCEELIGEVVTSYNTRFEIPKEQEDLKDELARYYKEKDRLFNHFPSPESFIKTITPYKNLLDRKDEQLENARLKCMRVEKQTEDLRSALEARLMRVGLKKLHAVVSPEQGFVFGKTSRLDWGPANLVGKRYYPPPPPLVPKVWCPPPSEETEIKLCLTDSVKGFLAWKKAAAAKKPGAVAAAAAAAAAAEQPKTSMLGSVST